MIFESENIYILYNVCSFCFEKRLFNKDMLQKTSNNK